MHYHAFLSTTSTTLSQHVLFPTSLFSFIPSSIASAIGRHVTTTRKTQTREASNAFQSGQYHDDTLMPWHGRLARLGCLSFLASPLSRESACTYSTKDIHTTGKSARACIELWNGMEPSWEKLSRVECYGREVTHDLFYYSRVRDGGTVAQHIKKAFNPFY